MAEQFYTIPTSIGKAKIANSIALGTKVDLKTMKIGDSNGVYYNPSESQTDLVHVVYTCEINNIEIDKKNANWINVVCAIPADVGNFYIREVGIFDADGDLIAIGKYPETYKPLASDGSTKELYIKMTFEVTSASSVILKIDPTVILATKTDISNLQKEIDNNTAQLSENVQKIVDSNGYGIINGLNVSAQNKPNMSVSISPGVAILKDGTRKNINSSILNLLPSTDRPRKDLVIINSEGNIEYLVGELGSNLIQGKMTYTILKNAISGDRLIMQGISFVCVSNNAKGNQFNLGTNTSETASNIVNALNSHDVISKFFNASSISNVVTLSEKVVGGGNTPDKAQNNGSLSPPSTSMVIIDGSRILSAPIVTIPPITPEGSIALAEVLILPSTNTIDKTNITDKRLIIEQNKKLTLKTNDYINVKSFGAIGDGINDDTKAIQNAINSGNNIYFPNGTYFITESLRYNKDNLKLFGHNATIIGQCYGLLTSPEYDEIGSKPLLKNIVIEGLTFKRKDLFFDEIDKLLFIRHVDGFIVRNCRFIGWNGDAIGIDLLYGKGGSLYSPLIPQNITIENSIFDGVDNNNSQAIFILQGMKITIKNNLFINTSRNGMPGAIDIEPWKSYPSLVMVQDIDIIDNIFENIRGTGGVINAFFRIENAQNNLKYPIKNFRIKGNKFSNCLGQFIYFNQRGNLDSTYWETNNVEISDNTFNGSEKTIWQTMCIYGMNNVVIKNNVFNHLHGVSFFGTCKGLQYTEPKNIDLVFSNNVINDFASFSKWAGVLFEIGLNDGLTIDNNYFTSDDSLYPDYVHTYLFRLTVTTPGTKMVNYVFRNNICYDKQSTRTFALLQDVINNNSSKAIMGGNILGGSIIEHNTTQE